MNMLRPFIAEAEVLGSSSESYVIKGATKVIERFFTVPLDYSNPNGKKIRLFARNLVPLDKVKSPADEAKLPYMLYLQGGPGLEVNLFSVLEIANVIHEHGYQTLWMDPRGTGMSTPVSADLLSGQSDAQVFEHLKHFRADNIVRDCEAIRQRLLGDQCDDAAKWSILGQSFGGFCAFTYLSLYPDGLKQVFLTGGLAPVLLTDPIVNYEHTIKRVSRRNVIYYDKYPEDVKRVRAIMQYLDSREVVLPGGGRLTPPRWQQLGIDFGMSGGIDRVHQLVFRAYNDLELLGKFSFGLLHAVESQHAFDSNPIYAILHEPIYCQGRPANWAAARVVEEYPQYSWSRVKVQGDDSPVYFTGEMIFPQTFDDFVNLKPLKGVANMIAQHAEWSRLYDLEKLSQNEVPVTAASYFDDMYVDFDLAQQTVAAVQNVEQFVTNQHVHSALRNDPKTILDKLFELSKRERD